MKTPISADKSESIAIKMIQISRQILFLGPSELMMNESNKLFYEAASSSLTPP
jgi:hypothetical protein